MPTECVAPNSISHQDLIAHALGNQNASISAHLEVCEACRLEFQLYSSLLQSTRLTFSQEPVLVRLVPCRVRPPSESSHCEAGDPYDGVRIMLSRHNEGLNGHILQLDGSDLHWDQARVRLFDSQGMVSSSPVDSEGKFTLPNVAPDQRYSLGVVMNRGSNAELRIVGDFSL